MERRIEKTEKLWREESKKLRNYGEKNRKKGETMERRIERREKLWREESREGRNYGEKE